MMLLAPPLNSWKKKNKDVYGIPLHVYKSFRAHRKSYM